LAKEAAVAAEAAVIDGEIDLDDLIEEGLDADEVEPE
jgi:hypothetical protein